jgi:putative ABC transport system permease protein
MRAVRLAFANLRHGALRTTVSVAGVAFAVLLIFMQFGFLGAVRTTATLFYDSLDFDLILLSGEYRDMLHAGTVADDRLLAARYVDGVASVRPLWLSVGMWRDPRPQRDPKRPPRRWNILVVGVEPSHLAEVFRDADGGVFPPPGGLAHAATVLRRGEVLLDRRSWPLYGEAADREPGRTTELNDRQVTLGGEVEIGTGFGYNGLALADDATFAELTARPSPPASFALVRLTNGTDREAARSRLRALGQPGELTVLTRDELTTREREFWERTTSVGLFFTAGAAIAFIGGLLFVLQMMVGDILSRIREFATLKAMGYPDAFLASVVIWQALLLSLAGYAVGLAVAWAAYLGVSEGARIPIAMNAERALLVLGMSLAMCFLSGLLAVFKLRAADPADLF